MFGGIARKRKKIGRYKFGSYWFMRYDCHTFSGSLRRWRNIGRFNFDGVAGNPPNIISRRLYGIYTYIQVQGSCSHAPALCH